MRRYPVPPVASPIPPASGPAPYRMALGDALRPPALASIQAAGELRFQCVGDTGGLHNPIPQRAVAAAMASQCVGPAGVSFFYHLGDIVYLHGERAHYGSQFFDPYADYPGPILGVAGNHDGDVQPGASEGVLEGFAEQFCAPPTVSRNGRPVRAQHQPNVYWTLRHEWLTIIGAYTGVPDGGHLGSEQMAWLEAELRAAPSDATLILAMHHPVFSVDKMHGSNLSLRDQLDTCFDRAGRVPDAVFSAHAHNYQRFTRLHDGRPVPYVVAGSGGYPELHRAVHGVAGLPAAFTALPEVYLESHQHATFGFLTVTVRPDGAEASYNTVVGRRPVPYDSFVIRRSGASAGSPKAAASPVNR